MIEKDHQIDDYFEKYKDLVIRNVYVIVKDYHEAQDICQEAFSRLLLRLDKVPPKKVRPWLLRVSKHLAIDHLRKGGRHKTNLGLEISEEFLTDEDVDPVKIIVEKEQSAKRQIVLRRLKEVNRNWYEAIVMSSLENMNNYEIAKRMGINAGLVSLWKHKGRKWLQKAYEEEYVKKS